MANRFSLESTIEPTVDERAAEQEAADLRQTFEDELGDMGVGVDGGGLGGARAGGGGGLGGVAAGGVAGRAISSGAAGTAAGGLASVALAGAVGFGILQGVQRVASASPAFQQTASMFGEAMDLFFRPFGNALAGRLRPLATNLIGMAKDFDKVASNQGLAVAIGQFENRALNGLGTAFSDALGTVGVNVELSGSDVVGGTLAAGAILKAVGWPSVTASGIIGAVSWPVLGAAAITGAITWGNVKSGDVVGALGWGTVTGALVIKSLGWGTVAGSLVTSALSWGLVAGSAVVSAVGWPVIAGSAIVGAITWRAVTSEDIREELDWGSFEPTEVNVRQSQNTYLDNIQSMTANSIPWSSTIESPAWQSIFDPSDISLPGERNPPPEGPDAPEDDPRGQPGDPSGGGPDVPTLPGEDEPPPSGGPEEDEGTIGIPGTLPGEATGGIARRATPRLVGEAGPEAIMPLDDLSREIQRAIRAGMRGDSGGANMTGVEERLDTAIRELQRTRRSIESLELTTEATSGEQFDPF
jgi:hypothetical protein